MNIQPILWSFLGSLLLLMGACSASAESPSDEDYLRLAEGFQNPPLAARPRGLWDWLNGNYSLSAITEEMEEAKAKGMGGFDIWDVGMLVDPDSVVPAGPPFMGPESVQGIGHAVREAERLGLELGLVIASSWNAGGHWTKPEHGAMGLFRSTSTIEGPADIDMLLPFPDLPGMDDRERHRALIVRDSTTGLPTFYREVAVLAIPLNPDSTLAGTADVVDLSGYMKADGRLRWEAPPGRWRLTRYVCTGTGQPLAIPSQNSMGPMIDHFSREAMEAHLQYIIDRLQGELGSLKNRALKYLYTDSYEVNTAVWTPRLPEEFRARNGYDLTPYLPVLDGFQVGSPETTDRFLFDFKKTLSDLIIENHYRFAREFCESYGLGFYAEAGGPGPPVHNVPFEDLKALGALTVPRGEFWNRHPRGEKHLNELQIVKGIASAAHLYNQAAVEAESFTSVWIWQEGPAELKPLADRALCEGLNRFIYHTFPHTPPEAGTPGWVYNFGTLIHPGNGWWELSGAFHEYLSRCGYLLQQGNFVGDVAFYYGDRAPNFVGHKKIPPSLGFGYDYDVINSDAILNRLEVIDGKLCLPHGQCYELLVLPPGRTVNPDVLEKLAAMVSAGATIAGPRPERSHRLANAAERDKRVQELATELWGACDSIQVRENRVGKGRVFWGKPLREILLEKGAGTDLSVSGTPEIFLDFIHRRTKDADIYFLWNRTDRPLFFEAEFRTSYSHPEIWNPLTGAIHPHWIAEAIPDGQRLPLSLPPNGSTFVVFTNGPPPPVSTIGKEGQGLEAFDVESTEAGLLFHRSGAYQLNGAGDDSKRIKINLPAPAPVTGSWELRFPHGKGAPTRTTFPKLISWTEAPENGIRYFSGVASYHKAFKMDSSLLFPGRRVFLSLGLVREIAQVYLNGRKLGSSWCPPHRFDLTDAVRPGENFLVVEVANVMNNQMVGDAKVPEPYRRTKSNITKGPNAWMYPWAEAPLIESGLLGPVQLEFGQVYSLQE